SCQVFSVRTPQAAAPMMPAAISPTTVNMTIGPQLRSLPTRTGLTGVRLFLPLLALAEAVCRPLAVLVLIGPSSMLVDGGGARPCQECRVATKFASLTCLPLSGDARAAIPGHPQRRP